jgi:VanZ family protein
VRLRRNPGSRRKTGSRAVAFGIAAILYACLIFYFSSRADIPDFIEPIFTTSDKLVHLIEFALLGGLLFLAFASAGWRPWDAPLAMMLGVLYGATDEIHQLFVPGRFADPLDALVNGIGVVMAVVILAYFDRRSSPSEPPAAARKG